MTVIQCACCGTLVSVTPSGAPWVGDGLLWCGWCDGDRGTAAWLDDNPDVWERLLSERIEHGTQSDGTVWHRDSDGMRIVFRIDDETGEGEWGDDPYPKRDWDSRNGEIPRWVPGRLSQCQYCDPSWEVGLWN